MNLLLVGFFTTVRQIIAPSLNLWAYFQVFPAKIILILDTATPYSLAKAEADFLDALIFATCSKVNLAFGCGALSGSGYLGAGPR